MYDVDSMAPKRKVEETWVGYGLHYSITSYREKTDEKRFIQNIRILGSHHAMRGQVEKCPETGKEHWQIYFFSKDRHEDALALARLRDLCANPTIHVVKCTDKQHAINTYHYAWKDESSLGEDYRFEKNCDEDTLPKYILDSTPTESKKSVVERKIRTEKREILYWFGPPCTGKSWTATQFANEKHGGSIFKVQASSGNSKNRWLGDYKGEAVVIIDEFNPCQFDTDYLKMLLDRQPQQLTTMAGGKSTMFDPLVIILINNFTVENAKKWCLQDAWRTRITKCTFMNTPVPAHLRPKDVVFENC